MMRSWKVVTTEGNAGAFHARPIDNVTQPEIWIHEVHEPALVLGSTQPESLLNSERASGDNIEICRRRSGGGLVRVDPDELWVDIVLPAKSHLWERDIGTSMLWVGQTWALALKDHLPATNTTVYSGPLLNREIGRVLCFAGMGSGEVQIDDYKVVGISQRRTREAARFQCLVKRDWYPDGIRRYLSSIGRQQIPWEQLRIGFPPDLQPRSVDPKRLLDSFTSHLPTP